MNIILCWFKEGKIQTLIQILRTVFANMNMNMTTNSHQTLYPLYPQNIIKTKTWYYFKHSLDGFKSKLESLRVTVENPRSIVEKLSPKESVEGSNTVLRGSVRALKGFSKGKPDKNSEGALTLPCSTVLALAAISWGYSYSILSQGFSTVS